MSLFRLHWLTGETQVVEGDDIADAMNQVGIGAGALCALDYYERIEDEDAGEEISVTEE